MTGECYINGKDAYSTWGIVLTDSALTALMTPAPLKPFVENKARSLDGKAVSIKNPKVDEREVQLTFSIVAKSKSDFLTKYDSFCTELKTGSLEIKTYVQPSVLYRMVYGSCSQFSMFNGKLGKFVLRVTEPNPNNRAV